MSAAGAPPSARPPSAWVRTFGPLVPAGGSVLDVACGDGRHSRWFAGRGHPVVAVDRDTSAVADLAEHDRVTVVTADLESPGAPPFAGQRFAAVVVTYYLHRPLLRHLVGAVDTGGVLLYETYAQGQERFGRPTNPDWLLRPGELLAATDGLRVIAYEDLVEDTPRGPAALQRICAVHGQQEAWRHPERGWHRPEQDGGRAAHQDGWHGRERDG